ncbi:hypothetical protein BSCG_04067 [Bacteroides sp. 2_2_4]|nr:hypothetical protein BSCG_04067 [Bacteroides sp. 2_2_4]
MCGLKSPLNYSVSDVIKCVAQTYYTVFMTNERSALFHTLMLKFYAKK